MSATVLGQVVSHYRVLQPLGEGGMGVVYRGEDIKLGRPVALKFIGADRAHDRQTLERFLREARTASALNHPNICTIYEIDEYESVPFIAMELLEGQTLERKIGGRPLGVDQVLDYAIQICDAVDAAHQHGILHRDIKPANIFVTSSDRVKVLDFGLAKSTDTRTGTSGTLLSDAETELLSTRAGVALGTIAYMSPEQARGEDLDPRSDLFAVGVVLYEMVTGQRSFQGSTSAVVFDAILNREPAAPIDLNANVPAALERIIARALEKDRQRRYQSAADLRADLQHVKVDRSTLGVRSQSQRSAAAHSGAHWPSAQAPASVAPASTRVTLWAAAGVAGAVIIGGALWMYRAPQSSNPDPALQKSAAEIAPVVADTAATPPLATSLPSTIASSTAPPPVAAAGGRKPVTPTPPGAATPAAAAATTASSTITPATAAKPGDALAEQVKVARAKLDARLYDQAMADVRSGLAANPGSPSAPSAHLLLGTIFERQGRPDDAMAAYVELRSRHGGSAEAAEGTMHLASLILQSKRNDREETARNLLSEVTQMPDAGVFAPQALVRRAALEDRGRMRVADATLGTVVPASLISFRQLVDSYPAAAGVDVALARLGDMYEDLKRYELAGQALLDLARRFPNSTADAAWRAGELFERRLKDPQRAREAYALVPPRSERYRDAQKKLQP